MATAGEITEGRPRTSSVQPGEWFLHRRRLVGGLVRLALLAAASLSVIVTAAIVYILISESLAFFRHVSLIDFLTDTQWTPLFANPRYGILPLLSGTLVVAGIALLVAIPAGTTLAIYLSEYAPEKVRETIKPCSSCWRAFLRSSTATSRCCSWPRCCAASSPGCRGSTCWRPAW